MVAPTENIRTNQNIFIAMNQSTQPMGNHNNNKTGKDDSILDIRASFHLIVDAAILVNIRKTPKPVTIIIPISGKLNAMMMVKLNEKNVPLQAWTSYLEPNLSITPLIDIELLCEAWR